MEEQAAWESRNPGCTEQAVSSNVRAFLKGIRHFCTRGSPKSSNLSSFKERVLTDGFNSSTMTIFPVKVKGLQSINYLQYDMHLFAFILR